MTNPKAPTNAFLRPQCTHAKNAVSSWKMNVMHVTIKACKKVKKQLKINANDKVNSLKA